MNPKPDKYQAVHMAHCYQGENWGCKYGYSDCPAASKPEPKSEYEVDGLYDLLVSLWHNGYNQRPLVESVLEKEAAINALVEKRVAEAQTNAVAWCIGLIDGQHALDASSNETDRTFKHIKNNIRDVYKYETGVDPAPHYPITAKLSALTKQEAK